MTMCSTGHSLGTVIAGFAGRWVNERTTGRLKVGRMTGLDPAGPLFFEEESLEDSLREGIELTDDIRLDKTDAVFVDVIHTDSEPFVNQGFGTSHATGHVDFYPKKNRGGMQCNHVRAVYLFAESVERPGCGFKSFPCSKERSRQGGYRQERSIQEENEYSRIILLPPPGLTPGIVKALVASGTKNSDWQEIQLIDENGTSCSTIAQSSMGIIDDLLELLPILLVLNCILPPNADAVSNPRTFADFLAPANSAKCYDGVGCFSLANGAMRHTRFLPDSPQDLDTKFELYFTRDVNADQHTPVAILKAGDQISPRNLVRFNPQLKTVICTHGYLGSPHVAWFKRLREAFYLRGQKLGDHFNLIFVDWSGGAQVPSYYQAAANTELVGRQVGNLVMELMRFQALEKIHLIGFSMGCHVSGFAGKWMQEKSGRRPARITGLDPAGPLWTQPTIFPPASRLDPTDADFVDNIHTDAMPAPYGLGSIVPMGHVDFYPNGAGEVMPQPGCEGVFRGAVLDYFDMTMDNFLVCSHVRAPYFFAETLYRTDCSFKSFPCPSTSHNFWDFMEARCFSCSVGSGCGIMGYDADKAPGRGKQYLALKGEARVQNEGFCAKQVFLKVNANKHKPVSELKIVFQDSERIYGPYILKSKDGHDHKHFRTDNDGLQNEVKPKEGHGGTMVKMLLFPPGGNTMVLDRLEGMVAGDEGNAASWNSIELMTEDGARAKFCSTELRGKSFRRRRSQNFPKNRRHPSIKVTREACLANPFL
ncbi:unnamed protein product [Cyprideis torosa]|uniref:Lipase domain-containing protein n=1 Tax=Cyprideis torosa TaxID=163714 RepID=A0A7R8ZST5_9CRUS|nr:unnamed protein product [Cyprideis torosa]CAG0896303.1 unnamed protein product [Cyprideis torosa]